MGEAGRVESAVRVGPATGTDGFRTARGRCSVLACRGQECADVHGSGHGLDPTHMGSPSRSDTLHRHGAAIRTEQRFWIQPIRCVPHVTPKQVARRREVPAGPADSLPLGRNDTRGGDRPAATASCRASGRGRRTGTQPVGGAADCSICRACSRVASVMSMPPSMRASSSTRWGSSSVRMALVVCLPSERLLTKWW